MLVGNETFFPHLIAYKEPEMLIYLKKEQKPNMHDISGTIAKPKNSIVMLFFKTMQLPQKCVKMHYCVTV